MARTDIRTTVKRIRRTLASGHRGEYAALATGINETETTVTFDSDLPRGLGPNSLLNVDLEQMRVRSIDEATKTAVVVRGWGDSVGEDHAIGEEIAINPRFSLLDIYTEVVNEVEAWGPMLWQPAQTTFAVASAAETVELPVEWLDMYFVIAVSRYMPGFQQNDVTAWPRMTNTSLQRSAAGLFFASAATTGLLLRLGEPVNEGTVHVTAALPFTLQDRGLDEDLVDDVGIPSSSMDLLEMGVRMRLLNQGEIGRSARQAQGDARVAAETPVGSMVPVLAMMERTYAKRFAVEQRKLYARYPITAA